MKKTVLSFALVIMTLTFHSCTNNSANTDAKIEIKDTTIVVKTDSFKAKGDSVKVKSDTTKAK